MNFPLIEIACPVCRAGESEPYAGGEPDFWPQWRTVRCRQCQLVYVNPRPSPQHTETGYRDLGRDPARDSEFPTSQSTRHEHAVLLWLESLLGRRGPLQVLDFGCGYGEFLRLAREHGHQVCGLEIARWRAAYVRDVLRIPVHEGDVGSAGLAPASFDLIYAAQVFEHLDAPRATLLQLARALRGGGVVCLSVPNLGSLGERCRRGSMLDSGHLSYFDPHSLRYLLQACGLHPVCLTAGVGGFAAGCRLISSDRLLYRMYRGLKTATAFLRCGSDVFAVARKPGGNG